MAGFVPSRWERATNSGKRGPVRLPSLVGVVRHPNGLVLVDTGIGEATRRGEYPGWPLQGLFHPELAPAGSIAAQLDQAPRLVVLTHLHYDHVSGLLDLPPTTVWMDRRDWWAYGPGAPGVPARRLSAMHTVEPLDLDTPGRAGRALGRPAVDAFGDDAITVISTPGHSPGSVSVLVQAADGPWLFIGDTFWLDEQLDGWNRPWLTRLAVDSDWRALRRSQAWTRWLASHCPDLHVVAAHEPRWAEARP